MSTKDPCQNDFTQRFKLSSCRGFIVLYINNDVLPAKRSPLVCVCQVPNQITYADFCQLCGPDFINQISQMQIIRISDHNENRCYSILIKVYCQDSADRFFRHFNTQF
ncbi:hypothetical protein CsatB_013002 [Cannabis sativa]